MIKKLYQEVTNERLTIIDLIDKAFNKNFILTKEEVKDVILLFQPSDLTLNWETKRLFIKPYSIEFSWGGKDETQNT